MEILKKIWSYLTLKKDLNAKDNAYLKTMHGINKLSILMFMVALTVLIYKCLK